MTRKLFRFLPVAALALSLAVPVVASAAPAPVANQSIGCFFGFTAWQKRNADAVVALVRANDGSPQLAGLVQSYYRDGCGAYLDLYVRLRVSAGDYAWYLAFVDSVV